MRQIKNFMEAKRPMWNCNECKCITMQCWKESEAFCGCGEWGSPLPPLENVIERTTETTGNLFVDADGNYIEVSIDTDPETGDTTIVVIPYWIFEDERYIVDGINLWQEMFETTDDVWVELMFEYATEFPSEVFEALEEFYENPTEENYEAAHEALISWIPEEW